MTQQILQQEPMNGESRFLRAFPPKPFEVHRARNATLWASDGRTFIDVGGASHGVAVVGHDHPDVVAAVRAAAGHGMHLGQGIPTPARARFLERLHGLLPAGLSRTFLANSGAEAVECALKLAVAATGRGRFVALEGGFHGRTAGALSVTHKPAYRDPFAPMLVPTDHVPADADALAGAVGPETAAVVVEPVQGEGGVRPVPDAVLRAARDLCDDHGAVLVFDEVQTGLGRTGTFLACERAGVVPDAVALGKGLAGGVPVGACVVTDRLAAALPPGGHGSTYGGAPLACAAGLATLDVLVRERLMDRATLLGDRFAAALRDLGHPAVAEVRHAGMMACADLRVRPGPVLAGLQERGFLALSGGARGVRFLPPLTIAGSDLDGCVAAFAEALG